MIREMLKKMKKAISPQPSGIYLGHSAQVISPTSNGAINVVGTDKVQSPIIPDGASAICRIDGHSAWARKMEAEERNSSFHDYVFGYIPGVVKSVQDGDSSFIWNNIARTPIPGNENICDLQFMKTDINRNLGIDAIDPKLANKYGTALYFQMHAGTVAKFKVYVFPKILEGNRNIADGESWAPFENLPKEWTNTHPYGKRMRSIRCWESAQIGMVETKPFNYAKGRTLSLPKGRFAKILKGIISHVGSEYSRLAKQALSDINAGLPVIIATTDVFKLNKPGQYTHRVGIREYMNEQKQDKRSFSDQLLTRVVLEALYRGEKPELYDKYIRHLNSLTVKIDSIIDKGRNRGQAPIDVLSSMEKKMRVNAKGYYSYAVSPFIFKALWPKVVAKMTKKYGVFAMMNDSGFSKARVKPGFWMTIVRYPIIIPEAAMSMRCFSSPIKGITVIGAITDKSGVEISATDVMAADFDGDYFTAINSKIVCGINHRKVAKSSNFRNIFLNTDIATRARKIQEEFAVNTSKEDPRFATLAKELLANQLVAMSDSAIKKLSYVESLTGRIGAYSEYKAILSIIYQEAMSGMKHSGSPVDPAVANEIIKLAIVGKEPTEAQMVAFCKLMGEVSAVLRDAKNVFVPGYFDRKKYNWMSPRTVERSMKQGSFHAVYGPKLDFLRELISKIETVWTGCCNEDIKVWNPQRRINPTVVINEINNLKETFGENYGALVRFMVWFLGDQSRFAQQFLPVPNGSRGGGEKLRYWNSLLRVDSNDGKESIQYANWFDFCRNNGIKVSVGIKQIKARMLAFAETLVALAANGADQNTVFAELGKVLRVRQEIGGAPGFNRYDLNDHLGNPVGANHRAAWVGYEELIGKDAVEIEEIVYSALLHAMTLVLGPINKTGHAMRYIVEDVLFYNILDEFENPTS